MSTSALRQLSPTQRLISDSCCFSVPCASFEGNWLNTLRKLDGALVSAMIPRHHTTTHDHWMMNGNFPAPLLCVPRVPPFSAMPIPWPLSIGWNYAIPSHLLPSLIFDKMTSNFHRLRIHTLIESLASLRISNTKFVHTRTQTLSTKRTFAYLCTIIDPFGMEGHDSVSPIVNVAPHVLISHMEASTVDAHRALPTTGLVRIAKAVGIINHSARVAFRQGIELVFRPTVALFGKSRGERRFRQCSGSVEIQSHYCLYLVWWKT